MRPDLQQKFVDWFATLPRERRFGLADQVFATVRGRWGLARRCPEEVPECAARVTLP
jgi:hypothetical protein